MSFGLYNYSTVCLMFSLLLLNQNGDARSPQPSADWFIIQNSKLLFHFLLFCFSLYSTLLIPVRGCGVFSLVNRETLLELRSELRSDALPVTTIYFPDIRTHAACESRPLAAIEPKRWKLGVLSNNVSFLFSSGYEPFCINMTRPMPLWYVRSEGRFIDPATQEDGDLNITRVQKRSVVLFMG